MDLNSGHVVTRREVAEIPNTDPVVKAVATVACKQGFESLKFKNWHGVTFHDADWIAGVDHEEKRKTMTQKKMMKNVTDKEEPEDDEMDDHEEEIDQNEINELVAEAREEPNPNQHQEEEPEEPAQQDDVAEVSEEEEEEESQTSDLRRSTRTTGPAEKLEPKMKGQSYAQGNTTVKKQQKKLILKKSTKVKF